MKILFRNIKIDFIFSLSWLFPVKIEPSLPMLSKGTTKVLPKPFWTVLVLTKVERERKRPWRSVRRKTTQISNSRVRTKVKVVVERIKTINRDVVTNVVVLMTTKMTVVMMVTVVEGSIIKVEAIIRVRDYKGVTKTLITKTI